MQELGLVVPLLRILRDPQMQYLLLRCCAHPRVSHLLRGVPPDLARPGAVQYDATILEGLLAGPPSGRPAVGEGPARGGAAHPNGWARPHFGSPRVTCGLPWLLGSGNGTHGCFQCPPTGYRGHDGAPTFGPRFPRGLAGPCRPRGCSPPGESGRGCPPTPTRSLGGIHPLSPTVRSSSKP